MDDIYEVWASDPLFYPAIPPAHWLMCAEVTPHPGHRYRPITGPVIGGSRGTLPGRHRR